MWLFCFIAPDALTHRLTVSPAAVITKLLSQNCHHNSVITAVSSQHLSSQHCRHRTLVTELSSRLSSQNCHHSTVSSQNSRHRALITGLSSQNGCLKYSTTRPETPFRLKCILNSLVKSWARQVQHVQLSATGQGANIRLLYKGSQGLKLGHRAAFKAAFENQPGVMLPRQKTSSQHVNCYALTACLL